MRNSPFDIRCLESEGLTKLFNETASYLQRINIEMVSCKEGEGNGEKHSVKVIGLRAWSPTILFAESLDKGEEIEAIAHELCHLLLIYRFGLRVIDRRFPCRGSRQEMLNFCLNTHKDWAYLLGQVVNTAHHLILVDYLKEEYGIESHLHLRLLRHNFLGIVKDGNIDKESQCAKGLIAFEYDNLIKGVESVINTSLQTESFSDAHDSAKKHFGKYSFRSIPIVSCYEMDILSLLEDLSYQREDFIFFPRKFCARSQ